MGGPGSGRYPKGSKVGRPGTESHDRIVAFNKMGTRIRHMKKIDTRDPEAVWKRYEEYVEMCSELGVEQTMGMFSKCVGVNYAWLSRLMNGNWDTDTWTQESIEALHEIYEYIEGFAELALIDPTNRNAAQRIFHMKNRYGWKDVKEQRSFVEQKSLEASQQELEDMARKYLAQAGVVEGSENG